MSARAADHAELDLELARSILGVVPRLFRIAALACREGGAISPDRFKALKTIEACPGMRSGELAQRWHLTAPAVTHVVESLVSDGLVSRAEDERDRRAVLLTITAAGRRELRRFEEVAATAIAEALATLEPSERRRVRAAFADLERAIQPGPSQEAGGRRIAIPASRR